MKDTIELVREGAVLVKLQLSIQYSLIYYIFYIYRVVQFFVYVKEKYNLLQ